MATWIKSAVLLFSLLLQITVVSTINIFGVISNLFLVILVYTASVSDMKTSIWFGTVSGILIDFLCAKIFGVNTALCLLLAVTVSFLSNRMRDKNIIYYLIVTFLLTGLYEYISSIFLIGDSINVTLGYVFVHKVIPTAIVNTIWMIPTYLLLGRVLKKYYS